MNNGNTTKLTATVEPNNAFDKTVKWESLNKDIATIDSSTGEIKILKSGKAKIVARTSNNKKDTIEINVISKANAFWWPIGSVETESINGKLFARGTPALGKERISRAGGGPNSRYTVTYPGDPAGHASRGGYHVDIAGLSQVNKWNVISIGEGTVVTVVDGYEEGKGSDYGNYVRVNYGNGLHAIYGHLHKGILVKEGEKVDYGQVLGKLGHTGNSSAAHLHFEVRINGTPGDATLYVSPYDPRPYDLTLDIKDVKD